MRPYKVLVTHEVLSLPRPSVNERRRIVAFLDELANDPYQKGDCQENDELGRTLEIRIVGKYALTFWADHAVREIKVTRIEKADRG